MHTQGYTSTFKGGKSSTRLYLHICNSVRFAYPRLYASTSELLAMDLSPNLQQVENPPMVKDLWITPSETLVAETPKDYNYYHFHSLGLQKIQFLDHYNQSRTHLSQICLLVDRICSVPWTRISPVVDAGFLLSLPPPPSAV